VNSYLTAQYRLFGAINGRVLATIYFKSNEYNITTSCARGDTICLCPLQVDNIFAFIRQVAPVPACWLFKTSATSWTLTFWPWKWCPSHVWRGLLLW